MIILDVSSKRHTYDLPMAWLKGTKESAVARETMDSFRWAAKQEQFEKQQQELQQQQQEEDNTLQQLNDEETPKQQEDDEFHRILHSSSNSNNHSSFSSSRRILMKRVQFRDLSEHDVTAKEDEEKTPQLCPEECQELWYSKSEIHALRKDMERELRQYKTRRNSANNAANTSIACFRGLEEVCSLRAHMDKKARKAAALRVLLQEQARQLESGCVNADTLAKRCARASTASKELALQLAQQDEAEAREIWGNMDQTIGEDKVEARTETKDLNKTKQNPLAPEEEEEDTTVTTASLSLEEEEPPFSHQAALSPFFPKSPRPKVKPKFSKRGLQSRSVFYPPSPLSRAPNQCTNVAIGSSDTNEPDLQQKPFSSSLRHIEYRHHSHHYDDNNNKDHHVKSPLHRSSSDVMSKQRHFIDYSKSNRSQSSLRLERGTDAPPVLPPPPASATKTEDKEPKEEKVENHDVLGEDDSQQQRRRIVATAAKSPSRRRCISPPVKTSTTRTRRRSKSPGNALKNKDEDTGNRRRHVLRLEPSRSSSAIMTRPNGDSWWISPSSLSSSSSSSEQTDREKSQKAQPREEEKVATTTEDDKATPQSSSKASSASTRKVIKVRGQLPVGCSSPSIFSSPNSPFASSRKIKARLVSSKNSDHKKTNQDNSNNDDSNDNHIDKTSSSHRNNSAHADTPTFPATPRNRGRSPARVSSATSPRRHRARRPVSPGVTYQPPLPLKSPSFNDGIQKLPESPKSPHKTKLSINRATKQMVIEAIEG